jgi:hypothetical protein
MERLIWEKRFLDDPSMPSNDGFSYPKFHSTNHHMSAYNYEFIL